MSQFESIDPDEPATIENVLAAIMRLRAHDEATLAQLVSEGKLQEIFPFRPRAVGLPPNTLDEADVPEASPHPLTDSRYEELVQSSMRSGADATPPARVVKYRQGASESPVYGGATREIPKPFRIKIRPLHDRVIVKRIEEERKTASGVVIPDTATEKPDQGEIVAVGKGKRDDNGRLISIDVKVGDKVLFGRYSGQTVKVIGDELLVIRADEIMGVIEGAKKK